jgi:hypothetical protein
MWYVGVPYILLLGLCFLAGYGLMIFILREIDK